MSIKRMRLFFPSIKHDVDCDKYMGVGVESVTVAQWKQMAELHCDTGWRVTKAITERNTFDWIILVYLDNKLKKVTYFQSYTRCSGIGYKGCGLSYAEKKQIDQFFLEVEDEGHPYAFIRRRQPVILETVYAKPTNGRAGYKSDITMVTAKLRNGYSKVTYEDMSSNEDVTPHKAQGMSSPHPASELNDADDLPDLEESNEENRCTKKQKKNNEGGSNSTSPVDLTADDGEEMPLEEQYALGQGREDDSE
jgi:hypothetical protein